ncbi:uncharacterized protein LOC115230637 [Octopus sinensis]|uniref:Uncharacterized protein LOC115230637 n=1 Tax=Octopus sinensis TaxID=2607531 RepID=A0A7E6EKZ5_9MOLL|nr:uncharacterized protein LOC115230637 [Octopus sinensis]
MPNLQKGTKTRYAMPSSQTVWMLIAWSLGLIALALITTSIGTDYWYEFSSQGNDNKTKVTNVGMWRTCTKIQVNDGWHQKECENIVLFEETANLTETQETLQCKLKFISVIGQSPLI